MGKKFIDFFRIIKNLIFVPKCAACEERLSPIAEKGKLAHGRFCLCESCAEKWQRAKATMCPVCYNISPKCTCTPNFFFQYQPSIPSLCFYRNGSNDTPERIILTLKRKNDSELFDFLAEELRPLLDSTLERMGLDAKDCIFTYVPRKSSSVAKYGFDQGKSLALAIAKQYKARLLPLFLRTGGKEQKKLDKRKRKKNVQRSVKLNQAMLGLSWRITERSLGELLNGKNVIIVDDVLTSGATLQQAVRLLRSVGTKNTVAVCIAKTAREDKNKKKS